MKAKLSLINELQSIILRRDNKNKIISYLGAEFLKETFRASLVAHG